MTKKKNPEDLKKVGVKPMYETAEQLQRKVDDYFNGGAPTRKHVIKQEVVELPVLTITGLAYYLGFESRQSFYDYEKKPIFAYTIKRARLFIEMEYETLMQQGVSTAIFGLKNFGWKDTQDVTIRKTKFTLDMTDEDEDD